MDDCCTSIVDRLIPILRKVLCPVLDATLNWIGLKTILIWSEKDLFDKYC